METQEFKPLLLTNLLELIPSPSFIIQNYIIN